MVSVNHHAVEVKRICKIIIFDICARLEYYFNCHIEYPNLSSQPLRWVGLFALKNRVKIDFTRFSASCVILIIVNINSRNLLPTSPSVGGTVAALSMATPH